MSSQSFTTFKSTCVYVKCIQIITLMLWMLLPQIDATAQSELNVEDPLLLQRYLANDEASGFPSPDLQDEALQFKEFVIEKPDPLAPIRKSWKLQPVFALEGEEEPVLRSIIEENGGHTPSSVGFVLLFISNSEGCFRLTTLYSEIAKAYWDDLEKRRSVSTSKVYFLMANATRNPKIFRDYRISKVPTLTYLPPNSKYGAVDDQDIMDLSLQSNSYETIAWIEQKSGLHLPAITSGAALMGSLTSSIENWGIYLVGLQILFLFLSNIYRFTSKVAWMMLSFLVYFISISGCIFSLLRGAPPFGYSDKYGLMFIYPDRSGQFFFEGIFIGILNVFLAMLFVFSGEMVLGIDAMFEVEKWFDAEIEAERVGERREQKMQRLYKAASICLTIAAFISINLFVLFKRKAPWYQPFRFL
jgi:hypothetical protein